MSNISSWWNLFSMLTAAEPIGNDTFGADPVSQALSLNLDFLNKTKWMDFLNKKYNFVHIDYQQLFNVGSMILIALTSICFSFIVSFIFFKYLCLEPLKKMKIQLKRMEKLMLRNEKYKANRCLEVINEEIEPEAEKMAPRPLEGIDKVDNEEAPRPLEGIDKVDNEEAPRPLEGIDKMNNEEAESIENQELKVLFLNEGDLLLTEDDDDSISLSAINTTEDQNLSLRRSSRLKVNGSKLK